MTLIERRTGSYAHLTARASWVDDAEAERQKRVEATNALYRREAKVPYKRARLWQVGILIFIVATVILIGLVKL